MAWSAIQASPYNSDTQSIFCLDGTKRKRIEDENVFEWGIDVPLMPTLSAVTSGSLTGSYRVRITYARKERNTVVSESNPSDYTEILAASSEDIRVTFDAPTDPQVNCIRAYRSLDGDYSDYYHDRDYNYVTGEYSATHQWEIDEEFIAGDGYLFTTANTTDGTDDCYTWEVYRNNFTVTDEQVRATGISDNEAYFDLSNADADLGSSIHSDHDRPPAGSFVAGPSFNGTVFIAKDNKLYFSKPKQPEYFPAAYYVDVSPIQYPCKAMCFFNKRLYFLTRPEIYYIYGTTAAEFLPMQVAAKGGAVGPMAALGVEGHGIFHVLDDGLYLCLPSTDSTQGADRKVSGAFDPIFRGQTVNGVAAAGDLSNSWLHFWKDRLYFGYPGYGETYPSNILVFYLSSNRVGYHTRGSEIRAIATDYSNDRVIAVDDGGYVWTVEDSTVTNDHGEAIAWEIESKDFTLQTRKHFPRWVKYDVDAEDATTCTGDLILDGASVQSHTITGQRNTRRRLVAASNGNRCAMRVSGTGPAKIYSVESE